MLVLLFLLSAVLFLLALMPRCKKKQLEQQYRMFQEGNEFSANEAQKARDYQTEMWNAENEYNTPEAQRQRLEAAGLNPYMMMDGGSAGNAGAAGSSPSPSSLGVPTGQAPQFDFSPFESALNGYANRQLLAAKTKDTYKDIDLKSLDVDLKQFRNDYYNLFKENDGLKKIADATVREKSLNHGLLKLKWIL